MWLKCRGGKGSLEQSQKLDLSFRRLGSCNEHGRWEIPDQDGLYLPSENLGGITGVKALKDPSR